jgi:hypothetical protein
VEEEMTVPLDHAGHQRGPRQLDHARTGGRAQPWTGRLDPIAAHQHGPALVRARINAVEDAVGAEQDGLLGSRGGRDKQQQAEQKQAHTFSPNTSPGSSPVRGQYPGSGQP